MQDLLNKLITPTIITAFIGLISSIYAHFQKKKEEYRKYVYESKQKDIKELTQYAEEIVVVGTEDKLELKKLLFKISQKINPYGREIKSFGKYQWIRDDGYIWNQIEKIKSKIEGGLEPSDLEELAYRIQISKRLLDVKVEVSTSPNSINWFSFLQYLQLTINIILSFGIIQALNKVTDLNMKDTIGVLIIVLIIGLIIGSALLFILPELYVNDGNDKVMMITVFYVAFTQAGTMWYIAGRTMGGVMFAVSFAITMFMLGAKSTIIGRTEIGKVSTIYAEEYEGLQDVQSEKLWKKMWKWFKRFIAKLFHLNNSE